METKGILKVRKESMKKLKKLGVLGLAASMSLSLLNTDYLSVLAKENNDAWQLSDASLDKTEGNDVYLKFKSGQKARITFLNNEVLRIDVEPESEEFEEYPEPMNTTHTTKITAKSEKEYDEVYNTEINVDTTGDAIIISPKEGSVALSIDKASAKMKLQNGETILWEEEESLQYDGTETIQTLKTKPNEYFYGGGQQNGFFSHKNRKILIENKSTWVSGGVSSPNPFYISTEGYGAMRNTFQPGSYDFSEIAKMEHDENRFDAYYFAGDIKEVLSDYIELTGNPMFMPKYAFYQGNADCYNGEGEDILVDGINRAKQYEEHDMPVGWFLPNDGYGCGYGKSNDPDENIKKLNQFVEEAKKHGFVSGLWTENDLDKLDKEVAEGGTQMVKTDVAWVGDGYSFGLNAVRQAFEGIENNSDNRGFVVSLDGWAGTQRYAGLWSGDQTGGNWEYIRFHIPTYIGAGLSGNPNVGSDLDGIYGSDKIISTRDFQWKAFTPIEINMDGWTTGGEKNPWFHGEPYTSINRMYLKMKSAFMPYNYTYAKEAHDTGTPMVRALVLEYPDDPFTWGNQTQYEYLWGENLLVAPLYQDTNADENGNDVRNNIYLPDKNQIWIDYFSGKQYQGGQVINNFDAPLWKLPLFVKNGAILPKDVENNSQLKLNGDEDRIFEVYPAGNTEFTMYDDDGMSKEYKEGKGATTRITSVAPEAGKEGKAILTVEPTKGEFTGMKKNRGTQFVVNVSQKPSSLKATVGGEEVVLKEVHSEEEYANGTNVYYYNEKPNLNHYGTEGEEFAKQEIITTPKVMVKLDKHDITTNKVELQVEGFVNAQEKQINENDKTLTKDDVPVLTHEANDSSITLKWEEQENVSYGLIIDGQEDTIYRDVTSPFVHDSLNAGEEHTYQLVAYNTKSEVKGDVQRFETKEDRYKDAIKGITVTANSEYGGNVGGYPAINAVDGDESSLWYTNWEDPETYSGDKILTMDLQQAYTLDKLEYFNNGSAQIKDHEIQVSLDGIHYKTVEKSVWERAGEVRIFTDLNEVTARYVRLISHDPHHNSANEIRVYKKEGTSGFNPANTQGDASIGDDDVTFLENYMGVTAENSKLWKQAVPGDFNYNNEIDAYDLAFMMMQKNSVEPTNKKAAGTITLSADKTTLAAGEQAVITVHGNNLKDAFAFGLRLPLNGEEVVLSAIKTEALNATKEMKNLSKNPQDSEDYVVAFSRENSGALNGTMDLAKITITAKKDIQLNLNMEDAYVVSNGLDLRTALPGESGNADIGQLENILDAIQLDTSIYTADSASEFTKALKAARTVLDNSTATQDDMNEAIRAILVSLQNLQVKEGTGKAALDTLLNVLSEQAPKADYSSSALDKILASVSKAQETATNPNATNDEIHQAISDVIDRLMNTEDNNSSLETSKQLLCTVVKEILNTQQNEFTAESLNNLQAALESYEGESSTDATVIVDAIQKLQPLQKLDTQVLKTAVDIGKAMNLKKYDNEKAEAAIKLLQTAEELLDKENIAQEEINSMLNELTNGLISVLKTAQEEARDRLVALIADAKKIDLSDKSEESKTAFITALESAEKTAANDAATAAQLDEAYRNLKAAINGLQVVVNTDKSALKEAIAEAEKINVSFYTKESVDAFEKALQYAKEVFDDQTVTQEEVDTAYMQLVKAQKELVKNPETVPEEDKPVLPEYPSDENVSDGQKPSADQNEEQNEKVPATGQTSSAAGYAAMMVLAAGVFYIIRRKKA